MATQLGSVWIEVRLDTKKAEQDLEQLRRKAEVKAPERRGRQTPSPSGSPLAVPTKGPSGERTREGVSKVRGRLRKFIEGREGQLTGMAQHDPETRHFKGQQAFGGGLAAGRALAAGRMPAGLKVLGAAGAGYAAATAGIHLAPYAVEFLRGAGVEGKFVDGLEEFTKSIRAKVDALEANVLGALKAIPRTTEFLGASARITGMVPSFGYYWDQFQKMEAGEMRLERRFKQFRREDVAEAAGRTMFGVAKKSMSQ